MPPFTYVVVSAEESRNAPSEANFDETTSTVEAQESIQVTANSSALSRLDNGADQSEERRPAGKDATLFDTSNRCGSDVTATLLPR